jgi:hypothetical protein
LGRRSTRRRAGRYDLYYRIVFLGGGDEGAMIRAIVFLALSIAGLACGIWGSNIHSRRLEGFGAFAIGLAIAVLVYGLITDGVSSSNWGRFRRDKEPVRFWLSVLFVTVFAVVFTLAGLWTCFAG